MKEVEESELTERQRYWLEHCYRSQVLKVRFLDGRRVRMVWWSGVNFGAGIGGGTKHV